jgi:chromate transporter
MVKLKHIFFVFLKLGALTFGGGLAMLPIIKREILSREWIEETILDDYIAVAQVAPGMIAINIATLVGTHLRKRIGALIAVAGVALPSLIVIMIIASALTTFAEYPVVQSALKGITIVVVILLTAAIIDMGRKVSKHWMLLLYSLISFSAVYFFHISSVLIIAISFALGTLLTYINSLVVKTND